MKPAAIVLHGPTSAGKSSIARALQECALVPAFHITLDAFVTMSRRRDMRSGDEQRLAHQIHCNNLKSTLSHLVETHFELVVDLVLRDEVELRACFDILSGRPTYLIGARANRPPCFFAQIWPCHRHIDVQAGGGRCSHSYLYARATTS